MWESSRERYLGAFTEANEKDWGGLAVGLIDGDKVILEYVEPLAASGLGEISISQVVHGYRSLLEHPDSPAAMNRGPFGNSGACNINVNCPEGAEWQAESRSVALITSGGSAVGTNSPPAVAGGAQGNCNACCLLAGGARPESKLIHRSNPQRTTGARATNFSGAGHVVDAGGDNWTTVRSIIVGAPRPLRCFVVTVYILGSISYLIVSGLVITATVFLAFRVPSKLQEEGHGDQTGVGPIPPPLSFTSVQKKTGGQIGIKDLRRRVQLFDEGRWGELLAWSHESITPHVQRPSLSPGSPEEATAIL